MVFMPRLSVKTLVLIRQSFFDVHRRCKISNHFIKMLHYFGSLLERMVAENTVLSGAEVTDRIPEVPSCVSHESGQTSAGHLRHGFYPA
jgi:hypothetical protein